MAILIGFETAVDALRVLHQGGDTLPDLAHAAGRSSPEFAAGLLAFLADLRVTVETAARPERREIWLDSRGRALDPASLPPGWSSAPPPEREPGPVRPAAPLEPRIIHQDAQGRIMDRPGSRGGV